MVKSVVCPRRWPNRQSCLESQSGSIDGRVRIGASSVDEHDARAAKLCPYAAQIVVPCATLVCVRQFHLSCDDAFRCVTEYGAETAFRVTSQSLRDVVSCDVDVHRHRYRNRRAVFRKAISL